MKKIVTNSIVNLYDGQELSCKNTVKEIRNDLAKNNCVTLILSEQHNHKLSVHKNFICGYYYPE